jgi:hypothetical protein
MYAALGHSMHTCPARARPLTSCETLSPPPLAADKHLQLHLSRQSSNHGASTSHIHLRPGPRGGHLGELHSVDTTQRRLPEQLCHRPRRHGGPGLGWCPLLQGDHHADVVQRADLLPRQFRNLPHLRARGGRPLRQFGPHRISHGQLGAAADCRPEFFLAHHGLQ